MTNEESFDFSGRTLHRAMRAFDRAFYEDAVRDAYFSSLHAAKQLVLIRTGTRPQSHSGTRKRLSSLKNAGLNLQSGSVELLSTGYRQMLRDDHSGVLATVGPAQAEDYLKRAEAFVAAAKAACE